MPRAKYAPAVKHCSTCEHFTFKEREEGDNDPGCGYCLLHKRWFDYHKFTPNAKIHCDKWERSEGRNHDKK